jgi:hypothetical protein
MTAGTGAEESDADEGPNEKDLEFRKASSWHCSINTVL